MTWLFIEPGRIGDWILSQHVVARFTRDHNIRISWAVRRQVTPLLPLGPSYDEAISLPSPMTAPRAVGLAFRLLAHRTDYDGCAVLSPAQTGRFAVRWLKTHMRMGYLGPEFQCTTHSGDIVSYKPNAHHLMERALLPFYPEEADQSYSSYQNNPSYHPHLTIPDAWQCDAASLLDARNIVAKDFVLICPGAKWPGRLWDEQQWLRLAEQLASQFGVVVFATDPQCETLNLLLKKARMPHNVLTLPPVSLPILMAVTALADVVVSLDSGPMHMAAALGVPCVALYGPSNVALTGAVTRPDRVADVHGSLDCPPCITPAIEPPRSACIQPGTAELRDCMASISLQDIVDQVKRLSHSAR
ncbi:MAG: glycosyltransferase family 9 protein [Kiritimatiellae bacterium]|nr:glycosyltransferase family 9 protein [Kiritimatiellia bacterium]